MIIITMIYDYDDEEEEEEECDDEHDSAGKESTLVGMMTTMMMIINHPLHPSYDHLVDVVVILVVGTKRHNGPQAKTV